MSHWCGAESSPPCCQANRPSGHDNRQPTQNEISGAFCSAWHVWPWSVAPKHPRPSLSLGNWADTHTSRHATPTGLRKTNIHLPSTKLIHYKFHDIYRCHSRELSQKGSVFWLPHMRKLYAPRPVDRVAYLSLPLARLEQLVPEWPIDKPPYPLQPPSTRMPRRQMEFLLVHGRPSPPLLPS